MKHHPLPPGAGQPPTLEGLGWNAGLAAAFLPHAGPYIPGRVACRHRTSWEVFSGEGRVLAGISGAMRRLGRVPVVGDFVTLLHQPEAGSDTIVNLLPRKTTLTRGMPGMDGGDQVIAANVDTVFIVTAAGPDLNPRRLERFLTLVHASGALPVIVVNKADLAGDPASLIPAIAPAAAGVPVIALSALKGTGLSGLSPYLVPGQTVTLVGSSGVGKSTLINALLKASVQDTSAIRDYDGKGRHRTTVRRLFILENGALIIDNPGMREVGTGTAEGGLAEAFPDILELAAGCRFSDCRHADEPGCAVREAIEAGALSGKRLENYNRIGRELAFEREKASIGLARSEKKKWKEISRLAKQIEGRRER